MVRTRYNEASDWWKDFGPPLSRAHVKRIGGDDGVKVQRRGDFIGKYVKNVKIRGEHTGTQFFFFFSNHERFNINKLIYKRERVRRPGV